MTTNYHAIIEVGETNAPGTINTRMASLDAQISVNTTEITAARGSWTDVGTRLDALAISGGQVNTTANGTQTTSTGLTVTSGTGIINGAWLAITTTAGAVEYRKVASGGGTASLVLTEAHSGVTDGGLVSMLPASIYEASVAVNYGGAVTSPTMADAISWAGGDVYNILAYGAVGDGMTDDRAAIQAAIDDCNIGGVVLFPVSNAGYFVEYTSGTALFSIDKPLTLLGYGLSSTILLDSSIPDTCDVFYWSPDTAKGTDGFVMQGLTIQAVSGLPARHALHIDISGTGQQCSRAKIRDNFFLPTGGWSIYLTCIDTGANAFHTSQIENNLIYSGLSLTNGGDSLTVIKNTFAGYNGVSVTSLDGAKEFVFAFNNFTARGGIVLHKALSAQILYNNIEVNYADATGSNGVQVDLDGDEEVESYGMLSITVEGNNLTWGSVAPTGIGGIRINKARMARVENNFIAHKAASTTVDATSAAGQKVLNVAATTGFTAGDQILIGAGTDAREESGVVDTVQAGISLTLVSNLTYEHTLAQADTVHNKAHGQIIITANAKHTIIGPNAYSFISRNGLIQDDGLASQYIGWQLNKADTDEYWHNYAESLRLAKSPALYNEFDVQYMTGVGESYVNHKYVYRATLPAGVKHVFDSMALGGASVRIANITDTHWQFPVTGFQIEGAGVTPHTQFYSIAKPAGGAIAYKRGSIAWKDIPAAGDPVGWICTADGTPGTWIPFGMNQSANAYAGTNVTTVRSFDANTVDVAALADVVGTLIADLQAGGILKT